MHVDDLSVLKHLFLTLANCLRLMEWISNRNTCNLKEIFNLILRKLNSNNNNKHKKNNNFEQKHTYVLA